MRLGKTMDIDHFRALFEKVLLSNRSPKLFKFFSLLKISTKVKNSGA